MNQVFFAEADIKRIITCYLCIDHFKSQTKSRCYNISVELRIFNLPLGKKKYILDFPFKIT